MPVVLARSEVVSVLQSLSGVAYLAAALMYGSGLRLMECLRLRVKDIQADFGAPRKELTAKSLITASRLFVGGFGFDRFS